MTPSAPLRLGTRGSQLALYQAHTVARLLGASGGPACEIVIIKTSGDLLQTAPLSEVGGKRLFVKELEDALLAGEIDLAVHSSKDMPAILPDGLTVAGVLPREDPRDAVVLPKRPDVTAGVDLSTVAALAASLGPHPTIGTSSVRRVAQLTRIWPAARFAPIRGNLDTRLRKLDAGSHDALILAAAGLTRLGFESRISFRLPAAACVPAPGQGIIAIEIRSGDNKVQAAVAAITDHAAGIALDAERALVEALGGGCQTPIGALANAVSATELELTARVAALDGSRVVEATARGAITDPRGLGIYVAERLIAEGAAAILEKTRATL